MADFLSILTQHALSTEFEYRGDVDKFDIVFEGQTIHQLKRSELQRLNKESVLRRATAVNMKEANEKKIGITNSNGMYTAAIIKAVLLSITMTPEILKYAKLTPFDLIVCPLVVHQLQLSPAIADKALVEATSIDAKKFEVDASISVLHRLNVLLASPELVGAYQSSIKGTRELILKRMAKKMHSNGPISNIAATATLSWEDMSALLKFMDSFGATPVAVTPNYYHQNQRQSQQTGLTKSQASGQIWELLGWLVHQPGVMNTAADADKFEFENILESVRKSDAFWDKYKPWTDMYGRASTIDFPQLLELLKWMRQERVVQRIPALKTRLAAVMTWLMEGLTPAQGVEIAFISDPE